MSKNRSINSTIRISQSFAKLTYRQRDLWIGIISVADDQGRLPGLAAAVRSLVWAYDDISIDDVASDLKILVELEMVIIYENNNKRFLQIINWWKYQTMQWAGESSFPPPDGWLDRKRYHKSGRQIYQENWDTPGGFYFPMKTDDKVNDEVNDEVNVNVKPRPQRYTTKVDDKGSQIAKFYENNIELLTQYNSEKLKSLMEDYPHDWIMDAMQIACDNNARNLNYITAILKNRESGNYSKKKDEARYVTPDTLKW